MNFFSVFPFYLVITMDERSGGREDSWHLISGRVREVDWSSIGAAKDRDISYLIFKGETGATMKAGYWSD